MNIFLIQVVLMETLPILLNCFLLLQQTCKANWAEIGFQLDGPGPPKW